MIDAGVDVTISIYGKWKRIHLSQGLLRFLNYPSYVSLYQSPEYHSIAITVCEPNDVMSFKAPKNKGSNYQIYSKSYVYDLLDKNGLDHNKSYKIHGQYLEEKDLVVFDFNEAVEVSRIEKQLS